MSLLYVNYYVTLLMVSSPLRLHAQLNWGGGGLYGRLRPRQSVSAVASSIEHELQCLDSTYLLSYRPSYDGSTRDQAPHMTSMFAC